MKNLTIIKEPYDDEKMVFNKETGRYELTIQYLKDEYDQTYRNDSEAKRRIKLNSRVVYSYINLHTASFNRQVTQFLLHKTEEGRKFIFEILNEQIYADIQTGYNDLIYNPAISYTGNDKDRNEIKRNSICVAAEEIFENSYNYFGINIGYLGQFPSYFYLWARGN